MKKNLNIYSIVAFSLTMFAIQPVFGKCVTNHVKGTTFSNCNEEATASTQKAKGMLFKKSDDDTSGTSKNSNETSSLQSGLGKSDMPPPSGVDVVKLHHFKEGVSGATASPENWKEKNQ
ncbi:MAG: hypothetical protein HYX62_01380 [Gammaproteobacteria bacterium]|nr:hypothetical protein [Gammaproteobacteria bacterium]